MTDETALVPSPDVAALADLPVNEIEDALAGVWQSFGRRTVVDAWHIGVELRRVRDGQRRATSGPTCESIGMGRRWAYDLAIGRAGAAPINCSKKGGYRYGCSVGSVGGTMQVRRKRQRWAPSSAFKTG